MKIQLHDLIGTKTGVHFYLNSLLNKFKEYDIDVEIKSNYYYTGLPNYYPNIYKGFFLKKLFLLFISYIKFYAAIMRLKEKEFIIVSLYGSFVDLFLLLISKRFPNKVIIDLHEYVERNQNKVLYNLFEFGFKKINNIIIYHSKEIKNNLKKIEVKNKLIYTPHLEYDLDKSFEINNIDIEIIDFFNKSFIYFVFFGNIVESKGIYDLLKTLEKINFKNNNKVKILIAGQDIMNCIKNYNKKNIDLKNVKFIIRRINDDEMKFIYKKANYFLLPYHDILQSGVLEMAIGFRKPLVLSDINPFSEIIKNYPSFGHIVNTKNHSEFLDFIIKKSFNKKIKYYNQDDVMKYQKNKNFQSFIDDLKYHLD